MKEKQRKNLLIIVTIILLAIAGYLFFNNSNKNVENLLDAPEGMTVDKGLGIEIVREGDGDAIQSGQIAAVHYVGTFEDGSKFDSSRDRGAPFALPLARVKLSKVGTKEF